MNASFLLTSLLVVVAPGTGVLYTVSTGLSRGARASLLAAVGCTLGVVPHMAVAVLGLTALLRTSSLGFELLQWLGVVYLLWMAWNTLRDQSVFDPRAQPVARSPVRLVASAIMLNLLNPKLPIFFLAFLPQFIAGNDPAPVASLLVLGAVFMLMTLAIFALYGVFASFMRAHVLAHPKATTWLRRFFAVGFVALGLKLALANSRV